ncbi:ABC transporter permease subunit [Aeromonas salmonicida]|jgi:phosphate transport system permease protein|uniref:ABC-type phosphate transporter, permease component n=4 Tax=Aeromonas salmonicida TaxID=645 RepID=A4SL36_AERS4|nr:ABC transporter permease subunit [Aeromonas salmonicida]ABO89608.1 ABC-type phosphate transporter, permease component [Aeromonas salmonicida subsp. salmonicida A449]ARW81480.1 Phosphate transport system permease PstC [Aeromonas salmonicida]ASI23921.1 phosphate ABC transporter permease [Aeromonas salmonicida]ASI28239.1 phosphate ABC transporter permease [Aeromonas salmonicida]ASI32370.1 phosphate ABC transporter permease [Aeromonas salmonicida]
MSSESINLVMAGSRKRRIKDKLAKYGVTTGGALVLVALLLIFFYLLYVVKPIFNGATMEPTTSFSLPIEGKTAWLGMEEQNEIGYRFSDKGLVNFFAIQADGKVKVGQAIGQAQVAGDITTVTSPAPGQKLIAYGFADGKALVMQPYFKVSYPNDVRVIEPSLKYPFGEEPVVIDPQGKALQLMVFEATKDKMATAAVTEDGRGVMTVMSGEENFISGEVEWSAQNYSIPSLPRHVDQMLLTPNLRILFVREANRLSVYDIHNLNDISLRNVMEINAPNANVTRVELLAGASSLLVGNDNGVISQWFEVAKDGKRQFTQIRDFKGDGPVDLLTPEHFRKGFISAGKDGTISFFHATGETKLLSEKVEGGMLSALAISPRHNVLLMQQGDTFKLFAVENDHPEVTWSALWQEVWYEGYPEPMYVWQSTSASNDFEAKLSLVPLVFGTLKASFYAMMFAVPLGVAGAIYTAYFMSAGLRKYVKPTVEIMAALPTVILGFLAGLWLAPIIEGALPGVVLLLVLLPMGMLLTALVWNYLPERSKSWLPEGWHAILLIPVLLLIGWGAFSLSPLIENAFMHGDSRIWLTHEMGVKFDQRNSLVVGIAMGFAVIPTIFSIAEDAVFSVPKHLTQGSLALGATPWQTLSRVVILTASPGIFSAVMMGLGRAVGETMIVLMATGNTPIMDFSMFQGLRTLAANIAVEMPESEVGSSHYRVLFLAAFVLFVFTFMFNTLAEFVRQRLREKYSSM